MVRSVAERRLAGELGGPDAGSPSAAAYEVRLAGARAAVLGRLWRGLVHDPLPWVTRREVLPDGVVLRLADGRRLAGPPCDPWATGPGVAALELAGRTYDHPGLLMAALDVPYGAEFAAELDDSAASLALSRTAVPPTGSPARSWEWEQRAPDGHPYHPGCRSRPGFTAGEQLAYAPEHGPLVPLELVAAGDALVTGDWPEWLRTGAGGRTVLVPAHPWQVRHVLARREGAPRTAGVLEARPLLALRTLAPVDGDLPHVKTSLSARLTSSVRDISEYSVRNAAVVSRLVEEVAERLDGRLHITRTLAAAAAPAPDLAAMLRESPDRYADAAAGERVIPVGCLPAFPPAADPEWRASFAALALDVGLRMLALGVALEAHGQNLLVVVDARGLPVRLVYRDVADIRIGPARLAGHGLTAPALTVRQQTDDPLVLRRKLFGGLVSGALGPLAGDSAGLGRILGGALERLEGAPDAPEGFAAELAALRSDPLPVKALTLMRLSKPGSGDVWTGLPNPVRERGA
ncbi:IucA/IucC family siderophore biosynthesis protein [Streptomyces sp. NPDC097619]|uniref:IucA/IucC family siderophore biosynthesis protein n=1 Tax=Streptomyces sp. NPDC097619 TaxID=3157228 RepID=UPI00331F2F7E